ncbi:helix-turn-helix domain-containing protein [Limnohabitans sp. 63ED37-2]|uniref:helix-turn-helix domain-containing protein n=1 Tax=Limnohabitans sp. 63ED37-2 TaxID=1678128 RepID=UPI000705E9E4|nr:helix-turn-helix domain-containing protein [Limnohabitans sp. 63ED37-2]ALK88464.1 Cytoskeleton protein RodZ [Limnohabitans sp. 63ED37-2]
MTPSLKSESASETSLAPTPASAATAGQLLREARLKAGVHLAVLSVTLKVPVRQLEALEADELDPGKGAVFYRGLASSVCRHLHTDAAPILALLPQTSAHLQPLVSSIQPLESEGSVRINSVPWGRMLSSKVVWVAALLLFMTGAFLWMPGPGQWAWLDDVKSLMADEVVSQEVTEPVVPPPATVTEILPVPVVPTASADASSPAPSAASVVSPASPALAPAAPMSQPVQSAPPAKPAVSASAEPEWVFSASGDSWLEVRNAQKAVVWSGVVKAGESTRIQSPLPVSVVVGRAQVVTATLRGQPFDLKPHTQVTVARFEVKE